MISSSYFGILVLFLADWLSFLNDHEAMHPSLLMSVVRAFFNGLNASMLNLRNIEMGIELSPDTRRKKTRSIPQLFPGSI
jgi:hypothetical protein